MAFDAKRCRHVAQCIRKGTGFPDVSGAVQSLLFPRQAELFKSAIHNRQTAALAGRRSGKTSTLLAIIVFAGFCGWSVLIVYPNAKQARNKMLGKLVRLAKLFGLRVHTRAQDGIVELGVKGGTLEIGSAHTRDAIDSIRGDGLDLAIIDEPAAIADELLIYLMDEVIGPQLMDRMGRWVMTGTPPEQPIGRWAEITDADRNEKQENADARWHLIMGWSYEDNPELKDPERTIDAELARMGKTRESDTFLREYKAQTVSNDSVRPLHWTSANDYNDLPKDARGVYLVPVLKVTGVDIGWTDEDAIGTIYVYRGSVYLVEEEIQARQTDFQLADMLIGPKDEKEKRTGGGTLGRHRPEVTVGDSAQAKSIANLQAMGVPIIGARKGRGSVALGLKQIDDLMREGRFFAKRSSRFVRDSAIIQWKVPGKTLKEKPHSNIIPAVRYALDEVPPQYFLTPPPALAPSIFDDPLLKNLLKDPNADRPNYG